MSSEAPAQARPTTIDELSAAMAASYAAGQSVGVRGAGSKAGWAELPVPPDVVVDTRGLNQIVEHAAGDLVVTAQAGVTLASLQDHVAPAHQWLALDPPEVGATIGGIVASAASGPRRLLYGTPRDLLIGITVVLADGTIAHSGGKVVKNVAGYDLGKLYTGSFGTLGVIAQATFRLHPLPVDRRVVRLEISRPGAAMLAVKRCGAVPCAIEWDGSALTVVVEALESAAQIQAEDIVNAIGGDIGVALPPDFGQRPWQPAEIGLKVTHRLGAVDQALDAIEAVLPNATISAHAGSGVIWVGVAGGDLSGLEDLRGSLATLDGSVVVVNAPTALKQGIDVWGPAGGMSVMRRVKEQFDPGGRLSPGCFVGGI